jgi:hypothetical protein
LTALNKQKSCFSLFISSDLFVLVAVLRVVDLGVGEEEVGEFFNSEDKSLPRRDAVPILQL